MNRTYKQGIFNPLHKEKYRGTYPIIYRSGLELSFMKWVDNNSKILEWGSESVIIPYIKPTIDGKQPKVHKYYPDFNIIMVTEKGPQKYIVEIKPDKQTRPPTTKRKNNLLKEQYTYAVNHAKWKAAEAWCKTNKFNFLILTEKDLPK